MRNPCKPQSLEEFTQALGRGAEPNFVNTIEPIVVRAIKPFAAVVAGRFILAKAGDRVPLDVYQAWGLAGKGLVEISTPDVKAVFRYE